MLTQPIVDKLCTLRLKGMADAFREQSESADLQQLSFEERLGLLIDRQWNWRQNRALDHRVRNGRLHSSVPKGESAWTSKMTFRQKMLTRLHRCSLVQAEKRE